MIVFVETGKIKDKSRPTFKCLTQLTLGRGHPFGTYAKFFEKLLFLAYSSDTHSYV